MDGLTAVVVGGAAFIGAGIARRPAADGAAVAVLDRSRRSPVTPAVAFLLSDDASYVTGLALVIDGGSTIV